MTTEITAKYKIVKFIGAYAPLPLANPDVVSGIGELGNIAKIARQYGCSKPLVVTDEMLVKAGLVKICTDSFDAAGMAYAVFDKIVPNPHTELVEEGYAMYKAEQCDGLVALGGGSPMDACKMIGAMVAKPNMKVVDFAGGGKVKTPIPPLIAVPTTAGTASETSPGAVITVRKEQKKIVIFDKVLIPKVAVLDPKVLVGLPPPVTAATGMDALTHAVESFLSVWKNNNTRNLSLLAVEKIFHNLVRCYDQGDDLKAREEMLIASFSAGRAFSRANLGYVHAIAHQFGGMFHTPHGVANAMVLPYILEAYAARATPQVLADFEELCFASGLRSRYESHSVDQKKGFPSVFIKGVKDLLERLKIPQCVPEMRREHVEEIVKRALVEAHGGSVQTFPGYPVPIILGAGDVSKIVCALLPSGEQPAKL